MPQKRKTKKTRTIKKHDIELEKSRKIADKESVEGIGNQKRVSDIEKEIILIIAVLIIVIAFAFGFIYLYKSTSKIKYYGMTFERVREGSLIYYKTEVIIYLNNVGFNTPIIFQYNPYELDKIPSPEIKLRRTATISYDPKIFGCEGQSSSAYRIGSFLGVFGISAEGAVTSEEYAKKFDKNLVTCSDAVNQTVIVIQQSEKTSIEQDEQDCYVINVEGCDVIKGIEAFMLAVIKQNFAK